MKVLLILLLTSSCTLHVPKRPSKVKKTVQVRPKTNIENVRECIETLMSTHGVTAKKSLVVCERIYRRK
jgi:hypothetical protein